MIFCLEIIFLMLTQSHQQTMTGKIVGGLEANIEKWPFIGFIVYYKNGKLLNGCGSSLLSAQTALTAAHCVADVMLPRNWTFDEIQASLLMGHNNIFKATMIRRVIDYLAHEKYSTEKAEYDVAVVFIDSPVKFSKTVQKVLLKPDAIDYQRDKHLIIAGWGLLTNDSTKPSEMLQYLDQIIMPEDECRKKIPQLETDVICVTNTDPKKYVYRGDSGGPLITINGLQVGVVSYVLEGLETVTIYTSVAAYFKWINTAQLRLYESHCHKSANT